MSEEFTDYLRSRGLTLEVARAAKLRASPGVVVFPWLDASGTEVYMTTRSVNGTKVWRHSKGGRPPLYASPAAWEASRVALVEGQFDALACTQGGTAAFAACSSSLSDDAADILALKDEVLLAPDADDAGQKLLSQAIDKLSGRTKLYTVEMPEGCKDPAEVAEKAPDPAQAVAEVLRHAVPVEMTPEPDIDAFLAGDDIGFVWLLDGVIEYADRLLLTGREGAGKSLLCHQVSVQLTAGRHPFKEKGEMRPIKTMLVDCENSPQELRRRLRPLRLKAGADLKPGMLFVCSRPEGLDLGADDDDRAWLRQRMQRAGVELLCIGPLYKLTGGNPNDEQDAKPLAMFFDELRAEFGIAIILEAHMTHEGKGRPFGWSGWRRWPEIGLELKESGQLVHWRTPRHETPGIPPALQRGGEWPFTVATRPRDVLWARIVEHTQHSLTRPTVRDLSTLFGVSVGTVQKTLDEHRRDWEGMCSD